MTFSGSTETLRKKGYPAFPLAVVEQALATPGFVRP
jgi:hypothetical protein